MCARLAQRIHDDTTCHRCGYNLRTLSRFGRCPECAEPVSASLGHRETPAFRAARTVYVAVVALCYVVPPVLARFSVPGAVERGAWVSSLALALVLALVGFLWSRSSLSARYSVPVFLATLASYVYIGWFSFWAH
jgi:hypothetical protein